MIAPKLLAFFAPSAPVSGLAAFVAIFGIVFFFFGTTRVFGWIKSGIFYGMIVVLLTLFEVKYSTVFYCIVGFLVVITLFYWAYCFLHWLLIDLWKKPSNTEQERNKRR